MPSKTPPELVKLTATGATRGEEELLKQLGFKKNGHRWSQTTDPSRATEIAAFMKSAKAKITIRGELLDE